MRADEISKYLLELFPHLTKKQADNLARSGDDINILITRILDNNIENPTYDIKDLVSCNKSVYIPNTEYNFPEVFEKICKLDMSQDVKNLRKQACKYNKEAAELGEKALNYEIKCARTHYSIEADNKREIANDLNRLSAMILMRKAIERSGAIDLHGLTVKEAVLFIEDLYKFRRFKNIEVITGQEHKSSKLRPAVKKWFENKGFKTLDRGPGVYASKENFYR